MSMRISTAGFHRSTVEAMTRKSAEMAATQAQIASGKRVNRPSDDPAAAVHILQLQREIAKSEQFERNAGATASRLSFEEQALTDATDLLQRVRELTVRANSGTVDQTARDAIATELDARVKELMDLANKQDANGEYLFAGYSTNTQPFNRSGGTVSYAGDQGSRLIQISATQKVADGHSGSDVFMNVPQGNGTFVTKLGATNTGSGVINGGSLADPSTWVPGTYKITFSDPSNYQVTNAANVVVSSGTFKPGDSISFNGANVTIQGSPAMNDTFTLSDSGTQDMFSMLDDIISAVRAPTNTPAQKAALATAMGAALTQIDSSIEQLGNVRAEVGARLNSIDSSESSRLDLDVQLQASLSDLENLDYAEAVTRLNLQYTGLQAAQASYTKITQLSLFDYLR